MALTEFSTLTSIQTRANSRRVLGWTDKNGDTVPDPATLTAGFQFATGKIFEYLAKRYGETELESWTIDDCPARVKALSDDLSIWYFSSSNNSQNELIQAIYDEAIETLESLRDGLSSLYGATEAVTGNTQTEESEDPFEDRQYYNCRDDYGFDTCGCE